MTHFINVIFRNMDRVNVKYIIPYSDINLVTYELYSTYLIVCYVSGMMSLGEYNVYIVTQESEEYPVMVIKVAIFPLCMLNIITDFSFSNPHLPVKLKINVILIHEHQFPHTGQNAFRVML